jgi:hypothetical protein
VGSALLWNAKHALSALADPTGPASTFAANGEPSNSAATAGAAGPANHTTVRPGSHAGGPMIAPSTTRSAPMSSAMPVTVAGDTALAST